MYPARVPQKALVDYEGTNGTKCECPDELRGTWHHTSPQKSSQTTRRDKKEAAQCHSGIAL